MSILIRGREMPNNCQECVCINDEYLYCQAVGRKPQDENVISRRPDWCPLAEIPTPHGRLIDEEAVIDHFVSLSNNEWNQNVSTSWANAFAEAASDICDIPTIIEAEKGD